MMSFSCHEGQAARATECFPPSHLSTSPTPISPPPSRNISRQNPTFRHAASANRPPMMSSRLQTAEGSQHGRPSMKCPSPCRVTIAARMATDLGVTTFGIRRTNAPRQTAHKNTRKAVLLNLMAGVLAEASRPRRPIVDSRPRVPGGLRWHHLWLTASRSNLPSNFHRASGRKENFVRPIRWLRSWASPNRSLSVAMRIANSCALNRGRFSTISMRRFVRAESQTGASCTSSCLHRMPFDLMHSEILW